ncbi:hypothetical protein C2869_18435 [Saccharobesus litoralis]|uniref:Peptidase S8/S53 domain-containing protein n=1 Tax=Saccharobesus litoralis TaxID=2172099 RepID=A0A2S0VVM7_9ALTE|nr:S8 family serine peptidase [Saccharobesus litoralis]AWB68269.1 hypothetical protein C2869_18435 [Saccharobesus litoralis]
MRTNHLIFSILLILSAIQTALGLPTNLNGTLTDIISQDIEPTLDKISQQVSKPTELDNQLNLLEPIKSVITPVTSLPQKIDVKNTLGKTLWTEVEVENGWHAIQRQWLITLAEHQFSLFQQWAQQHKIQVLEQQALLSIKMRVITIQVPEKLDSYAALTQHLPTELSHTVDRNHVYFAQSAEPVISPQAKKTPQTNTVKPQKKCAHSVKIGMLDTAVDVSHPAFEHSQIQTKNFIPNDLPQPKAHGTAVAAILVSQHPNINSSLNKARLYAASVFYQQTQYRQGSSLMQLLAGLNWVAAEQVSVINLSLAGPDNLLLQQAIANINQQGITIVAAVGNEGPSAPPMYPAAYPDVIGVTAIDHSGALYRWANRGPQVDFASYGVNTITARLPNHFGAESGTSIATPWVSAQVACAKANDGQHFMQTLIQSSQDLGAAGFDEKFGHGLLSFD